MNFPLIIETHYCLLSNIKPDCKENCFECESDLKVPVVFSHLN